MRNDEDQRLPAPPGCYWRGDVLWARIEIDRRRICRSLRTCDPKVAVARREQLKERQQAIRHGDARLTFIEVVEAWSEWITGHVADRTARGYANALAQLLPWTGKRYFDEINDDLIRTIIKERRRQGVTVATIKRNLGALSSVFNCAFDEGWTKINPVLPRLRRLKERREPILLPSRDNVDVFINFVSRRDADLAFMVMAACLTGCRLAELQEARWENLDLTNRRLTVVGKGRKLRVIDLEPFGAVAVFEHLPPGDGKAPLFRRPPGDGNHNLSSRFSSYADQLEKIDPEFIRFRFHDLRHLHAVQWLRSGRSIYDLQQRLGHSSIKTTEIYLAYLTPEEQLVVRGQKNTRERGSVPDVLHTKTATAAARRPGRSALTD